MSGYWTSRGIPSLGFSLGDIPKYVTAKLDDGKFYAELKRRGDKLSGVYNILWSTLLVIHPDFVADILSEYLYGHFVDKGFYYSKEGDRIPSNLIVLCGSDWRDMRSKLTPDYESEKMVYTFRSLLEITDYMIEAIEKHAVSERDIDVKEFLACYTIDFIRHSVYQHKCNSFDYSAAESQKSNWGFLQTSISNIVGFIQEVQTILGLRRAVDDETYYYHAIKEDMRHREENEKCLLLERLTELIFEIDEGLIDTVFPEGNFDTSSTTLHFAIYELSKNPDIQDRLRDEINEVLGRHEGQITSDSLKEMTYLGQVIDETLRLYPPVPNRVRICIKDYTLRGTDMTIPEGARVIIPIFCLHRDKEYYPDPEKFDPERFNAATEHPLFMPFGEGSIQIRGIHLTLLQAKIGIISILRKFILRISPTTEMPLKLDPQMFLRSINKLYINAEKI